MPVRLARCQLKRCKKHGEAIIGFRVTCPGTLCEWRTTCESVSVSGGTVFGTALEFPQNINFSPLVCIFSFIVGSRRNKNDAGEGQEVENLEANPD